MALSVRKLRPDDDRSAFESGDPDLDRFFKRFAGQNQFKHYVGTTYVAEDDGCLLGFATVSAAQIDPVSARRCLGNAQLQLTPLAGSRVENQALWALPGKRSSWRPDCFAQWPGTTFGWISPLRPATSRP